MEEFTDLCYNIRNIHEISWEGFQWCVSAITNSGRCLSVKDLLDKFKSTLLKVVETAQDEIVNSNVTDKYLAEILCDISNYLHDISSTKELNFSALNRFEKSERLIFEKYDKSKHISGKQLLKLVVKDKVMIVLYILLCLIIAATVFSFALGI